MNVHQWNFINADAWNQLQRNMKYLYLTHNDRFTPSFDFLSADYKSLRYLRVDFSPSYSGVVTLELPSNLEALAIFCLDCNQHSWNYLAQSMVSKYEDVMNIIDDSADIVVFGNPNKESILSMNVFMQQKFEHIKFLKLCDCNFSHQFELQSILDSCNKLQYLSLIRVQWDDNRTDYDHNVGGNEYINHDPDVIIPAGVVGICFIDSCFKLDLSKCGDRIWEISVNFKCLTTSESYGGSMDETTLLQKIGKYCKGLRQLVLFGDVSTQSLKVITSKFNEYDHKIRYVISDKKESGMNKYWSKKFGCLFTRSLNPMLCPKDYDLLRGIKNKTTMFDASSNDEISWQYYYSNHV